MANPSSYSTYRASKGSMMEKTCNDELSVFYGIASHGNVHHLGTDSNTFAATSMFGGVFFHIWVASISSQAVSFEDC